MKKLFFLFTLVLWTNAAWSEVNEHGQTGNVIGQVLEIPEVKQAQVDVQFCFSKDDFKADLTGEFSSNISRLKDAYPGAIDDRSEEMCINPLKVSGPSEELKYLANKFNTTKPDVTLTVFQKKNDKVIPSNDQASFKQKLTFDLRGVNENALRGAAAGVVGSLLSKASRPIFKYSSNQKEPGRGVNIPTALLIGAVVDYLQRSNGETNEDKIDRNNAAAVYIADLFRFKDQNTYQLGLVMTLTSVPYFDHRIAKFAAGIPKEIDFRWAAAMLVPLAILGHREKVGNRKHEIYDKGIEFGTYAVYGSGLSHKYQNPNFGALAGSMLVFADEMNDSLKGSGGNMSARDAFWGVAGAYFAAWLTTQIPKGFFFQLYGKAIFASYSKQFN